MNRVSSFGQRYQTEVQAPVDPDPDLDELEPEPAVVRVPPIVLDAVRVPVVLEVDDSALRVLAGRIADTVRAALVEAVVEGFQDAGEIIAAFGTADGADGAGDDGADDGDPSSDRTG